MKNIAIFVSIILLFSIISYDSVAEKSNSNGKQKQPISIEKIKKHETVILPSGQAFEKIIHIFYKKEFEHKPNHPNNGGPLGKNTECFDYMFDKRSLQWKNAEPYIVDPANGDGLSSNDVKTIISQSINAWEIEAGVNILGDEIDGVVDDVDGDEPGELFDGKNEVLFESISDEGVIAFTIVWRALQGNQLIEWDIVFDDDADFVWGNAGPTSDELGDTSVMDFENIATHEVGHAVGMSHPLSIPECSDETMYAFATEGETKKRTLNNGDIIGIQTKY